jgi:phasin
MDTNTTTAAKQTKETFEKMETATTLAADFVKTSCSFSLKAVQEYNKKFLEFAHTNTDATFEFAQKLYGVKSPAEFMELSTEHARAQTQALTEQTKLLAVLAQKVVLASAEPLKTSAATAFNQAA